MGILVGTVSKLRRVPPQLVEEVQRAIPRWLR